ncbi:MAG: hypothetical protein Q9221_003660 [Calogaya cf. arnoldii]
MADQTISTEERTKTDETRPHGTGTCPAGGTCKEYVTQIRMAPENGRKLCDVMTLLRIGAGLVEVYLSRPYTTVIAGVRDPKHPTSQKLSSLSGDSSSKIIVVKIDNKSESDPATAVSSFQAQGVDKLDLVIANAGICNDFKSLATVDPAVFKEHVVVNGFAPLFLFQAVLPLMQKSEGAKFVGIGSPMGSIGGMDVRPFPMTAYGTSKAIFHWIVRKVHFEHPELVSLVVDPG